MFVEPNLGKKNKDPLKNTGWVEVIAGAMFSGKTEELIRRLNRAIIAKQQVEIFKPVIDTRYHDKYVVSHNETQIRSTPVNFSQDILLLAGNCDVVGIDEAQFFDEHLIEVVTKLADQGKRVIIAGLDMDYKGIPFGPMPALMAVAEFVTKVHPICIKCGAIAVYSHRLTKDKETVLVGEKEAYEPLCRKCYNESEEK
jgi:thymidine kinase